jgi:hypothetical protein
MATEKELIAEGIKNQFGLNAAPTPITGTSEVTPPNGQVWEAVQTLAANTRVASYTVSGTTITAFSGVDLAGGIILFGSISAITLSAGAAQGYIKGSNDLRV